MADIIEGDKMYWKDFTFSILFKKINICLQLLEVYYLQQ